MAQGVLAWLPSGVEAAWASYLSTAVNGPLTVLEPTHVDLQTLIEVANRTAPELVLGAQVAADARTAMLREIHAPIWLTPPAPIPWSNTLLVLRAFASDEVGLAWVLRLAPTQEKPRVALMPLLKQQAWSVLNYLQQPASAHPYVSRCIEQLNAVEIQPQLTLQSGPPNQQIIQAICRGDHELMVIAAEGHGEFVSRLLDEIDQQGKWPQAGVLVVKANHELARRSATSDRRPLTGNQLDRQVRSPRRIRRRDES